MNPSRARLSLVVLALALVLGASPAAASWPADGRALCTAGNNQLGQVVVADGSGGALLIWQDFRSNANDDLYADHVLASGQNVNVLVLDTEVYSNTGGQASKATPLGAVAKFAAAGKATAKKDLGVTGMRYGNVYVAQVAMGADDAHTVKTFLEAEAHDGPSLIIAYSQCIAHGIDMSKGMHQQKLAVESGYWPLYRYNPSKAANGGNPFQLDSKEPTIALRDYLYTEGRYRILQQTNAESAKQLLERATAAVKDRWAHYSRLASG